MAMWLPGDTTPGLLAGALLPAQLPPRGKWPDDLSSSKCPEKLGGLLLLFLIVKVTNLGRVAPGRRDLSSPTGDRSMES